MIIDITKNVKSDKMKKNAKRQISAQPRVQLFQKSIPVIHTPTRARLDNPIPAIIARRTQLRLAVKNPHIPRPRQILLFIRSPQPAGAAVTIIIPTTFFSSLRKRNTTPAPTAALLLLLLPFLQNRTAVADTQIALVLPGSPAPTGPTTDDLAVHPPQRGDAPAEIFDGTAALLFADAAVSDRRTAAAIG